MPEICSSSTPTSSTGGYLIPFLLLLILACSCCPNLPLQTFQKKRETSLTRPKLPMHGVAAVSQPYNNSSASECKTRPLHSAPSFHIITIFFWWRMCFALPWRSVPLENRAHTHAHKLLYKYLAVLFELCYKKKTCCNCKQLVFHFVTRHHTSAWKQFTDKGRTGSVTSFNNPSICWIRTQSLTKDSFDT